MAGPSFFTDDYSPDFGCSWPADHAIKLRLLSDTEAVQLAEWKLGLDAGNPVRLEDLPEKLQSLAGRFLIERSAKEDVIQFGWTLPGWRELVETWAQYWIHCIFGGNRSSKSVYAARLVVHAAMSIPEARIYCWQVNEPKSITEQQAYVWEALPERYKRLPKRKGPDFDIQYTQKNGFVGSKLILPPQPGYTRGSEIIFGTYQQYKNDPQVTEGWWAHLIWCDEECPLKMFERLLTRLYDARGRMLLTFTTIQGWSPLVAEMIGKARTVKKRWAGLLQREIPVAQESLARKGARIYYFWTQDNPFIPHDTIEKLVGRPEAEILSVAYGIPTKAANAAFPSFDPELHVVPHDSLPWLAAKEAKHMPQYTDYMAIDPAGEKPWFMLWGRVDSRGTLWIWAEWPDESYGPWAVPSDDPLEGRPGDAHGSVSVESTGQYVEIMAGIEDRFAMHERVIDPRGAAPKLKLKDSVTSIHSELEEALRDRKVSCEVVRPAPGLTISHGVQLIKDRLQYKRELPLSALNCPTIFISDRCTNLIDSFKNWTNRGSTNDAYKDPIDTLRYMLENGVIYISAVDAEASGQTWSY